MKAGDMITGQNLRAIRPGLGLPTKYIEQLMGKRVTKDVARGTPASWELLG
ncbi:Pseudaminic acid synthase [compost metagenome]